METFLSEPNLTPIFIVNRPLLIPERSKPAFKTYWFPSYDHFCICSDLLNKGMAYVGLCSTLLRHRGRWPFGLAGGPSRPAAGAAGKEFAGSHRSLLSASWPCLRSQHAGYWWSRFDRCRRHRPLGLAGGPSLLVVGAAGQANSIIVIIIICLLTWPERMPKSAEILR